MNMSQYMSLFLSESRDYLKSIAEQVAALEASPGDRDCVDALFRGAHSLKGMAASMDLGDIVEIAHSMEDLMLRVRDEALVFDAGAASLLFEGADLIEGLLSDVEQERAPRRATGDLSRRLSCYAPSSPAEAVAPSRETGAPPACATAPTAGEPQTPAPLSEVAEPRTRTERDEAAGEISTVRVRTEVLDHLINLTGELITNKHRLLNIGQELGSAPLNEAVAETTRLLRSLHDEVMKVRLMPFDVICDRFQRSVRALARKRGKELRFEIEVREIGLDRGILEQLSDPLNHILRNAVDHGIEESAWRVAAGKPAKGVVTLSVSRDRDRVLVTVSDDGRGMDPQTMKDAAVRKGLLSSKEAELLPSDQALMLACIPGFTTAKELTEVSGRGVGMDAVNASIQKMGGTLTIESEPGKGSSFTLRLPMTIAIIHALVVQCGPLKVAVPVSAVQRTVELRRSEVESVGRRRAFRLDEELIPLLSLNHILGVPLNRFADGIMPLFVTQARGRRVGIVVDRLLGQRELFVKPLGRPLSKLVGVAGGATLGDGEIVTILDVADLL